MPCTKNILISNRLKKMLPYSLKDKKSSTISMPIKTCWKNIRQQLEKPSKPTTITTTDGKMNPRLLDQMTGLQQNWEN
jgi:hypothetical protein